MDVKNPSQGGKGVLSSGVDLRLLLKSHYSLNGARWNIVGKKGRMIPEKKDRGARNIIFAL